MHRFVVLLTCVAGAGVALVACGGTGAGNLFGSGGGSNGGAGTTGATGTTGSTTSGPGATAASSSSGSGSTGGSAGTTSTSATSTSSTSTTSTTSSGGMVGNVICGSNPMMESECNPGQVCCFDPTMPDDMCGSPGGCAEGDIEIPCMGPSNCPDGEVCCGIFDPNAGQNVDPYLSVSCQASCDDPNAQVVLCSLGSHADPSACPANYVCQQSMWLDSGYNVCNPQ
jgi:hypothetical protein